VNSLIKSIAAFANAIMSEWNNLVYLKRKRGRKEREIITSDEINKIIR
jgi:hypothetical protein